MGNKYLQIIADENELKWFYKYAIPSLKRNELYFVSLSIRKKRLNLEEKKIIPHNEMFAKQQIRHQGWEPFIKHIRRLEVRVDSYFPFESESFIQNALVTYWNICPIDAYKAMKDQMNHLAEIMGSLTDASVKGSKSGMDEAYYKVRKAFDTTQSLFARNFGEKYWIDFDIDFDDQLNWWGNYEILREYFKVQFGEGNTIFVRTGGGIHCLVRKSVYKINPEIIYDGIKKIFPKLKEVIKNDNQMIPLPGTFQYGSPVVVLNKDDITEEMRPATFSASELMGEDYSKVGD